MSTSTKAAVTASAVACGVAIGAALALREPEPWPPRWYVSLAKSPAEHAALRRRAAAEAEWGSPPRGATLEYLRMLAIGAASEPGEDRPTEARVYYDSSGGYLLVLRGRFSTARIEPSPAGWTPRRPFAPCLTLVLDPTSFTGGGGGLGECEDLSALGESVELDLDAPVSRG
jgi:hypothetical protein